MAHNHDISRPEHMMNLLVTAIMSTFAQPDVQQLINQL